uniref:Uncharacterized protein n=1 Tax=Magallana gigas TaxID=29159 RepID=K1PT66_MAGGI
MVLDGPSISNWTLAHVATSKLAPADDWEGQAPILRSCSLLLKEASQLSIVMRLVDEQLTRYQRLTYRRIHGTLHELWAEYEEDHHYIPFSAWSRTGGRARCSQTGPVIANYVLIPKNVIVL